MRRLRVGDIIFVKGSTELDKMIELTERGKYNHVALYIGNGRVIESQGGREIGLANLSDYAVYDVGRVQMGVDQINELREYALAQQGKKYDWLLIIILALRLIFRINIPYKERSRRICSTFVRDCYSHIGINLTCIENCTPQELSRSIKIILWEGGK